MKRAIIYQRLEGAAIGIAAFVLYLWAGYPLLWFFVLLLAVDISMAGYLVNTKIGAHLYNLGHSFILPVVLVVYGYALGNHLALGFGMIWVAHIGMDRLCGFGLKHETGFQHTHLGTIGRKENVQ